MSENSVKTAVFTIVSLNYGAFAKTLMESLCLTHPDWARYVLLVDECEEPEKIGPELFTAMTIDQLVLPKMREFLFRYGIMELNTAAKPYMFSHLRRQGYERVVYIDPDILVLNRLVDVERLLDEGATGVLTPHLTAPLDDGWLPGELDIMRAGSFNLGFLAMNGLPASDAFLHWWEQKLEYGAVSDPDKGLFTDQKWVDLAPGMFGGFAILRDPGYNVAYWNLPHRPVTCEGDGEGKSWQAGGKPLRFFHFSGFDPLNPQPFSKHQNRLTLDTIGPARELALDYAARVLRHGLVEFRKIPYAFGRFSDGTPIPSALRKLYREDADVRFAAGADPFEAGDYFVNGEAGNMPVILRALWLEHDHLQRAFPDPLGTTRMAYYHWFAEAGGVEIGIPEAFIVPIRSAWKKLQELANPPKPGEKVGAGEVPYHPSLWARGLVFLHKRATGGKLSPQRLTQYQRVTGPREFYRLGYEQFRSSRLAQKFGLPLLPKTSVDPLQANVIHASIPPSLPISSVRRHKQRFSGLYIEPGQAAWWIGRQARFMVDQVAAPIIRLQGKHYQDFHLRANGKKTMLLTVGFNDDARSEIEIDEYEFDVTLELKQLPTTWPAILHLVPEISFIPQELGLNQDARRLSVQIGQIQVGGRTIFNALDEANPASASARSVPGVNVIGYARSEHGVGQSLRQFVGALDAAQVPSAIIDFNNNNNSRVDDLSLDGRIVKEAQHGINVFHINADQMPEVEMHLPSHYLARYNIGFWHWELPDMLDEHLVGFNSLHEVWVPTGFVQEAVAKRAPVPVVRMPHAISFNVTPDLKRSQFSLPEGKFLFLMMYDFSSYQERKNPQAALDAFDLAFGGADRAGKNQDVVLVIKTQNAQFHAADVAALRERLDGRSDVIWINQTLSRQQVYDLQFLCDALVSLHRSEGYGLAPAEAMFLAKPVIATNWSGNTEFMTQQNSLPVNYTLVKIKKDIGVYRAGQTWAEADVAHAASQMQSIVDDPALYQRIAQAARRTMLEQFSPEVIGQRILARLEYIQRTLMSN
jgi:glycosyltransferase involved in cell wall biosynthesis